MLSSFLPRCFWPFPHLLSRVHWPCITPSRPLGRGTGPPGVALTGRTFAHAVLSAWTTCSQPPSRPRFRQVPGQTSAAALPAPTSVEWHLPPYPALCLSIATVTT